MNRLSNISLSRIVRVVKIIAHGRPRCLSLVLSIVAGKRGLEIGGPSVVFRRKHNLPIYEQILSLDNCDFSQNTEWASHGESYCFSKRRKCGRTYFSEGSDLREIPDDSYDFLLSSHNLEHFANPIKALKEWQRVVKPGGHLVLVLPHHLRTFDRHRTPTTIEHMQQDYERNTGEDDLTHVEEAFNGLRLNEGWPPDDELRAGLMNNYKERTLHHHVFNEVNSKGLIEAVGFKVLAVETQLPFHIYVVAQTPP
jgi:SAM-dependent methyltransferase